MVQDIFQSIAHGSCLALCMSKLIRKTCLSSDNMMDVIKGWRYDCIDDDGFVSNPTAYLKLIDPEFRNYTYEIVEIKSLDEIPEGKTYPVLFSINGKDGHFVLANNKGIVWNSLDSSRNVNLGKPVSYRKIEVKE